MRRVRCWAAVGALLLAACSTGGSPKPSPGPPSPGAGARSIELTCADAGSGNAPAGARNLTAAGLILEGLTGGATEVPRASDVGLIVPPGSDQRFRKSPAYLRAGTAPVTVVLTAPAAGQGLAWVPAVRWGGGGPPDLRPWITNKVTFAGCPDRDSTYFGGLLATDPRACLDLAVQQPGRATVLKRLRLDGGPC